MTASASVTEEPLDVAAHLAAVRQPGAGAEVFFAGVVRDHDGGRTVRELEYLAYPSAQEVLTEVVAEFAADPQVHAISVSHRVGRLVVGDVALVAAVSCPHRGEAFAICARLVDEVKHRLPVWKRQVFEDGSDEWVNCP
jgi:molybdopterin synthase catalytic subunit